MNRLNSLPVGLHLDEVNEITSALHTSLRFILYGHLIDCYELMYWPFIVDCIHGRLRCSPEAEEYARKGFLLCVQRIEKNESGFYKRHHGTWLMLRSCTRSAFVLVAGARSGVSYLLPNNWKVVVRKVIHLLEYWQEESSDIRDRRDILLNLS